MLGTGANPFQPERGGCLSQSSEGVAGAQYKSMSCSVPRIPVVGTTEIYHLLVRLLRTHLKTENLW